MVLWGMVGVWIAMALRKYRESKTLSVFQQVKITVWR